MFRAFSDSCPLTKIFAQIRLPRRNWFLIFILCASTASVWPASFYTQPLNDPKAVSISPSGGDDTVALQNAVDKVQETTRQGIVFLGAGKLSPHQRALHLAGHPPDRLRRRTAKNYLARKHAGLRKSIAGKNYLLFRRRRPRNAGDEIPDASPGTFYSALANVDVQIENGIPARSPFARATRNIVFSRTWIFISAMRWREFTKAATWSKMFISSAARTRFGHRNLRRLAVHVCGLLV